MNFLDVLPAHVSRRHGMLWCLSLAAPGASNAVITSSTSGYLKAALERAEAALAPVVVFLFLLFSSCFSPLMDNTPFAPRTLVDAASLKAYYEALPLKTDHAPLVFGRRAHVVPRGRVGRQA